MRSPLRAAFLIVAVCAASLSTPSARAADKSPEKKPPADDPLAAQLPRIPPTEPADALKTFTVERGFHLELAACEPDVVDPVDACFDENGRMYVSEMRGYPYSAEPTQLNPKGGGKADSGVIRLLEDADGDGRFEKSIIFADKLSWPLSVCCYKGGVFVIDPPHVLYLKDTTGDGKADVREIVFSGFSRSNVQGLANNLKWGLDNRIYFAAGRNGGDLTHRGEKLSPLGGRDIRFDPATEKSEFVSGGSQFGLSMDAWGNRYVCNNSDHIQHVVFEDQYLGRNPDLAIPGVLRSIAKEGPAAPVYRRSPAEPWRIVRTKRRVEDPTFSGLPPTERVATGFFTSAAGVTIYLGDAYPAEYRGNAFVGDVGGNLIHRKTLTAAGASFVAQRADEGTEFVASTDNWFRPVNFVNAPDGTLFVLDMYRETIEHPYSIPDDIKSHLDLESGDNRGRIWRLTPPGFKHARAPQLGNDTTAQLVGRLESENGWQRQTAQRLLYERQDQAAIGPLKGLVRTSRMPLARMHALWTLVGLNALDAETVLVALGDADPHVREHAIHASERLSNPPQRLTEKLLQLVDDDDYRVRLQLAFSLGNSGSDEAVRGLAQLARTIGDDGDMRVALLSSIAGKADALCVTLIRDEKFVKQAGARGLIAELARLAGSSSDEKAAARLLAAVFLTGNTPIATQHLVLQSAAEGLNRRGRSLATLTTAADADAKLVNAIKQQVAETTATAADAAKSVDARRSAIQLLAFAPFADVAAVLEQLLSPTQPQALQLAAVDALAEQSNLDAGKLLLSNWRSYSPQVRSSVVDALMKRADRLELFLADVEAGRIKPSEIDRDKKQVLLSHPNRSIRGRSKKLFGAETSSDRAAVIARYERALELASNVEQGKQIFVKHCSTCHKVANEGHQVGPDLASVANKSPRDLLISILDPSREAQANYTTYTVVTESGKLYSGIIAGETSNSLTLRRAEGKEDLILRSQIESVVSNGVSLMPAGLEKEVTVEQMAHLLKFVKGIQPAKK